MESSDGSCSRTDVCYTPDSLNRAETFALLGIPGYKNNLVNPSRKGFNQPIDEGLSLVGEKIFFLPVGTSRLSPYKDNC
jgi:hypothetical protein